MDEYDIGVIIKDIGGLDLKTYEGRLALQRVVYLLQAFGLGLGYRYLWMVSGPISYRLAEDAFLIRDAMERVPCCMPVEFESGEHDGRYGMLKGFLAGRISDPDALDIAVSLCYMRNEVGVDRDEALRLTGGKRARYADDACRRVCDELEMCGAVTA